MYSLYYGEKGRDKAREVIRDLQLAMHLAKEAVETGICNRAEVYRHDAILQFSYPRVTRAA